MSRFSVELCVSHSAEKFRRAFSVEFFVSHSAPLGCHYFRLSKNFMLQRVMSRFSVELFCLTAPKNAVGESCCAVLQKISGSQKVYGYEEGG